MRSSPGILIATMVAAPLFLNITVCGLSGQSSTTPTSIATQCPAVFGIYGPIGASPASASSTQAAQTPSVSVQQNNTTGLSTPVGGSGTPTLGANTGAVPSAGGGAAANTNQTGNAQVLQTGILPIDPNISAFDVATALSGKVAGVTLTPIGPSAILYTLDPTKVSTLNKPQQQYVLSVRITDPSKPSMSVSSPVVLVVRPASSSVGSPGQTLTPLAE